MNSAAVNNVTRPMRTSDKYPALSDFATRISEAFNNGTQPMRFSDKYPALPDCRGLTLEDAKRAILVVDRNVEVEVLLDAIPHPASMFSMDYNLNRVRLMVDKDAKVARVPMRG
jgi:ethanolamine utilization protein EutP (predicted NTPase)